MPSISKPPEGSGRSRARTFPRKRKRAARSHTPEAYATFLIEVQDELAELIDAIGCLPHLAAMADAMAKCQHVKTSTRQNAVIRDQWSVDSDEVLTAADVIDLGNAARLVIAAVRVRLMRLCRIIGGARQT